MNLVEIISLEEKHAKLLKKEGIMTVEDLIPLSPNQIRKLARKIGVTINLLDTWQEHADLMRIEGIDPKIANVLNLSGVDSVKEFARRNAKSILEKLKQLKKENSNLLTKIPSQKEIESWISKAKAFSRQSKSKEKEKDTPEIITPNVPLEVIPFEEKNYGEFGQDYWNSKWERAHIIYTGRALRGEHYKKEIDVDVKSFIKKNDSILQHVIYKLQLRRNTPNETAWVCQKFVSEFLKYTYDDITSECPEYWQFPFETIQSEIGDCEDGSILIASLLINAGIPSWRVKVCAAQVMADPVVAPSDSELGGHSYCIYLADRPESPRKLEWVVLDWCYLQDPDVPVEEKPLARDGGQENAYKDVWFTFNDEHSWAQNNFEVKEGRISKNRQTSKDEVLVPLGNVLRELASEALEKVFRKYDININ
ncbi:MAG: DUF4332 domain-containing protein [Candidatus Thorarchaeota archaeon]